MIANINYHPIQKTTQKFFGIKKKKELVASEKWLKKKAKKVEDVPVVQKKPINLTEKE